MDPLWILTAFILGFIGFRLGLPPMVGYLIAGFVLQAFGVEGGESLESIADLGILLLLFSIGLKLHLRDLIRPEIWAGASIHMLITVVVFGLGIFALFGQPSRAFRNKKFQACVADSLCAEFLEHGVCRESAGGTG